MIALIQRVKHAKVEIDGETVSSIGHGLLILLGVVEGDTEKEMEKLASKCAAMRIFNDDEGVMNRSVIDACGEVMVVSQFTLAANLKKGNRPSYIKAARHETAIPMYEQFCDRMETLTGKETKRGRFGADMQITLLNDGPVTIIADTDKM